MKLSKIIGLLVLLLLLFIVSFYFWGKNSSFSEEDYTSVSTQTIQKLSNSDTLSIMTFNIGYLSGMTNNLAIDRPESLIRSNLNKTIKLFSKLNPDIIGLQEIDFASKRSFFIDQYQSIFKESEFISAAMAVNWDKNYVPFPYWPFKFHFGRMYSGQAVLSKFEILKNERMVLPQPESNAFYYNDFYLDRLAQISWLDFRDTKLLVINVHFEAWDGPTREVQAKLVMDFYREYMEDYPIIILGDFNCNPPFSKNAFRESTIQLILDEPNLGMCLDITDFKANEFDYYTFSSETPQNKIDYILYNTKFFDCLESTVIIEAGQISDHLPVMAKLLYHPEQK